MAAPGELDQDTVLRFLAERGGRARNADLLDHFRGFLASPDPESRARAREHFKELVNGVATVRQEPGSGTKYVQLRKKYRGTAGGRKSEAAAAAPPAESGSGAAGHPEDPPPPPGAPRGEGDGGDSQDEGAAREEEAGAEPLKGEKVSRGDPSAACGELPPEESDAAASEVPPEELSPRIPQAPLASPESPGEGGDAASRVEQQSSPRRLEAVPMPSGHAEPEEKPGGEAVEALLEEDSPPSTSPAVGAPAGGASTGANTPRCGHKIFRERMVGSSPQQKRGGLLHRGGSGGSRGGDSDSGSLASSSAEDESGNGGGSVALDPLEHEWMLCASDGRWESLESLLSCEPALLPKRDFITGFTCLHWAAKLGHPELLARLVNFAHRQCLPININARTSGGYTALHLAAMHGHLEVVKLLVGAYDADVDIRDYSGRKASHYLSRGTAEEVRSLVGALQDEVDGGASNGSSRWRLSRVLPSNLITYKLSHHHHHHHHGDERESGDGSAAPNKSKELSRKTSGSGRIKPRLNKIRFHTQIIHTTPSFRGDAEEEEEEGKSLKASFKLRPKSNIFG
ncbi:ankyrin repeat domain-containing protein SOWAHC [Pantherophis guttatus]|uniref:Ankyrin repeat domain-containing protein SOWAHC n=1 Tax=Pantherophis guttatus TaxID=94885 RepID=A0A6P9C5W2_PANGU|nr:ankyrin repeat domain-containing protein SOWAHC [Pantherophis guttatus]